MRFICENRHEKMDLPDMPTTKINRIYANCSDRYNRTHIEDPDQTPQNTAYDQVCTVCHSSSSLQTRKTVKSTLFAQFLDRNGWDVNVSEYLSYIRNISTTGSPDVVHVQLPIKSTLEKTACMTWLFA